MTWAATSTEPFVRGAIFYIFMRMEERTRIGRGRSLSLERMGSPWWVTFENVPFHPCNKKNEVLLPGSMTAAVSWVSWLGVAGGGFAVISSRLSSKCLCVPPTWMTEERGREQYLHKMGGRADADAMLHLRPEVNL